MGPHPSARSVLLSASTLHNTRPQSNEERATQHAGFKHSCWRLRTGPTKPLCSYASCADAALSPCRVPCRYAEQNAGQLLHLRIDNVDYVGPLAERIAGLRITDMRTYESTSGASSSRFDNSDVVVDEAWFAIGAPPAASSQLLCQASCGCWHESPLRVSARSHPMALALRTLLNAIHAITAVRALIFKSSLLAMARGKGAGIRPVAEARDVLGRSTCSS